MSEQDNITAVRRMYEEVFNQDRPDLVDELAVPNFKRHDFCRLRPPVLHCAIKLHEVRELKLRQHVLFGGWRRAQLCACAISLTSRAP